MYPVTQSGGQIDLADFSALQGLGTNADVLLHANALSDNPVILLKFIAIETLAARFEYHANGKYQRIDTGL